MNETLVRNFIAALALSGAVSCTLGGDGGELVDSPLAGGDYLYDPAYWFFPGVGFLSTGCTASLVSDRDILTAAHCISYEGHWGQTVINTAHPDWNFRIRDSNGNSPQDYGIERYTSWDDPDGGNEDGYDDIALLRLNRPVDPGIATPLRIASSYPETWRWMMTGGYGCNPDYGKRALSWTLKEAWGSGRHYSTQIGSCPGDSGGPTVLGGLDEIIAVTSAGVQNTSGVCGNDSAHCAFLSDAVSYKATVEDKMREWSSEACSAHDNDIAGCDAAGCAYYGCTGRCLARGTDCCAECGDAPGHCGGTCGGSSTDQYCHQFNGNVAACDAQGGACGYYFCTGECHARDEHACCDVCGNAPGHCGGTCGT